MAMTSAALVLAGCTVNQTLVVDGDGSGSLVTHAEVAPLLHDYLASLSEAGGGLPGAGYSTRSLYARASSPGPGIVVEGVAAPTPSSMDLALGFDSLSYALQHQDELSTAGAASIVDDGDATTLRLRFDRATWNQLSRPFSRRFETPSCSSSGRREPAP